MKVRRDEIFEFIVILDSTEFNRILVASEKWDESPEEVFEKIIKAGFDEGCEI